MVMALSSKDRQAKHRQSNQAKVKALDNLKTDIKILKKRLEDMLLEINGIRLGEDTFDNLHYVSRSLIRILDESPFEGEHYE
jgi:nitrogenase molybdenum-iron protein alpha/beta subunit